MNIKANFRNRCWPTSSKLPFAQRALGIKIAVAVSLVASLSLAGFGQSFRNLDFEEASLVPISGGYQGEVQIGPALPGWSVSTQAPYVLYDNMFLDSERFDRAMSQQRVGPSQAQSLAWEPQLFGIE